MHHDDEHGHVDPNSEKGRAWKKVLWIALLINAAMFLLEVGAGFSADSSALLADAVDFFSDATNYAISLGVMGMAVAWQTRAAFLKGSTLLILGLGVLANMLWHLSNGTVPEAPIMGVVGMLALISNAGVAILLFRFRDGDANMRSVWICTRNDVFGNAAVLLAALGVFGTASGYPDFIVAGIMSALSIWSGVLILLQAKKENSEHGE